MPIYQAQFLLTRAGRSAGEGPCRLEFDEENFTIVPERGPALSIDLADIDWLRTADFEIVAGLFSGDELRLGRLAKVYAEACAKLRSAWTARLVTAMLLSDSRLVDTFRGILHGPPPAELAAGVCRSGARPEEHGCEVRFFENGFAVLPDDATPFHVRLSDVDSVAFDADNWEVRAETRMGRLTFGRLAKRTNLFCNTLGQVLADFRASSAKTLHEIFRFLTPADFQMVDEAWRESRLISRARLEAIDPRLWPALIDRAISKDLRPYAEHLASLSEPGLIHASFKRLSGFEEAAEQPEAATAGGEEGSTAGPAEPAPAEQDSEAEQPAPSGDEGEGPPFIFCFFYPIVKSGAPANLVAQEVTSAGGRATYWFRPFDPAEFARISREEARSRIAGALEQLNTGLAALNFRREPIYMADKEIESQPRLRRYSIAMRRIPQLRAVRSGFLARSIHSSLEAWKKQVAGINGEN